jgi:hypothetical protein
MLYPLLTDPKAPDLVLALSGSRSLELMLLAKSRILFRISSSRVFVAAFKLNRSVALSLLRLVRLVISFWRLVAMFVRLRICSDKLLSPSDVAVAGFDTDTWTDLSSSPGSCMFCNASMVAEGGVFSPMIGFER